MTAATGPAPKMPRRYASQVDCPHEAPSSAPVPFAPPPGDGDAPPLLDGPCDRRVSDAEALSRFSLASRAASLLRTFSPGPARVRLMRGAGYGAGGGTRRRGAPRGADRPCGPGWRRIDP